MSEADQGNKGADIAVVIPCYYSAGTIEEVVRAVPGEVGAIICVDDASGDNQIDVLRKLASQEKRVEVLRHEKNRGVGAATISGYLRAIEKGARVIVKLDSDNQMNPAFIPAMAAPILSGEADYVKGNRFFDIERVRAMPGLRLFGNAGLTLMSRVSSGYWNVSDPTNGFTAIHADVAAILPLQKLHERYFFESDMLFRLNSFGARVIEQPIETRYGNEDSHLNIGHSLITFPFLHLRNFTKRLFYNYFLRGFDIASLYLLGGAALCFSGAMFGALTWMESARSGEPATTGTVMLSVTPLLLGFQLLLAFSHHDVARTPRTPIHPRINRFKTLATDDHDGSERS
ncbi:glycosyltransferase family 2 protein [Pelagibius marinus]|uniref:glycosyltransferase family 2 protein n=1 Tax=Pelagibius marinus TaxID=2762760 RepID=UPI001872A584|nr:glycosyltransferase family 2 protein [Pelagibius marinus]